MFLPSIGDSIPSYPKMGAVALTCVRVNVHGLQIGTWIQETQNKGG